MKLNCVIIDDDNVFVEILSHYIKKIDCLELSNSYTSVNQALNSVNFSEIDVLFLDVEMPEMTGLEFFKTLNPAPPVVFVSKEKSYATSAFDFDAIDYLHKPVSFSRFLKTLNKIKSNSKKGAELDCLYVRNEGIWKKINYDDISTIKADNNNVIIKTEKQDYKCNQKLSEIITQLPQNRFMQVHRSYAVNLDQINILDGEVILVGKRTIPVSKTYLSKLYERLNIHK